MYDFEVKSEKNIHLGEQVEWRTIEGRVGLPSSTTRASIEYDT